MFKYDEYPAIKKAYKEHNRLEKIAYKLDGKIWADGRGKAEALEATDAWYKHDIEVFAPIIFETFKNIKPKLYNERDDKYEKWGAVFANEWANMTTDQKGNLLGLVLEVGCGIYWLPEEYYNDLPEHKGWPWPCRHDRPWEFTK